MRWFAASLVVLALAVPASAQQAVVLEPLAPGLEGAAYFSPYENLDQRVLWALDQAKPGSTVYMSYYSLSFAEDPKMFAKLRDRGVTVRFNLYEKSSRTPTSTLDDDLIAGGFDLKTICNFRSAAASMHTKFTVVNEELVVTGSANLSASASLVNHEHVIVLKNAKLAREYIAEWNEQRAADAVMRNSMTPEELEAFYATTEQGGALPADWYQGRSAKLKAALKPLDVPTTNELEVVRTYFAPEDGCEEVARQELLKAKKKILVSIYAFSSESLAKAIASRARKGVEVTVIADDHQQGEIGGSVEAVLAGVPKLRYIRAANKLGQHSAQHQKYAVIDDKVVLGGSFNWTNTANRYNDENLVVVRSPVLAERFKRDFAAQLAAYDPQGPALDVTAAPGETTRVLFAVAYPHVVPPGYEVVVFGDAPQLGDGDPKKGIALRTSLSTAPNWLGSCDLPRDKEVTWRVALRKPGSITGTLTGQSAEVYPEDASAGRKLPIDGSGIARIVTGTFVGEDPLGP